MTNGLLLLLAALVHEDVAIVIAAVVVVRDNMPFALALALVYGGVVANNLLIYASGVLARRLPTARRWLIGARVERARLKLERHFVPAVLLCRTTPGLMYATFLACGWFRLPFARFALAAAVAAAVYVSLMLMLVVVFGDVVLQWLRDWAWVAAAAMVVTAVAVATVARVRKRADRHADVEKNAGPKARQSTPRESD